MQGKTISLNLTTESPTASSVVGNIENILFGNNALSIGTETPTNQRGGFWGSSTSGNDKKALIAAKTGRFNVLEFMVNNDMISNYGTTDNEGCTLVHYISSNYSSNPVNASILKNLV